MTLESAMNSMHHRGFVLAALTVAIEVGLVHLGRTYGSTSRERGNGFQEMAKSPSRSFRRTMR